MNAGGYILVIAGPDDAEAGLVHNALAERSVSAIWIDTADFPDRLGLIATPGAAHPGWLQTESRRVDLAAVAAIYRRSPAAFGIADEMSPPERRFALMEAVQGMGGVLASLRCCWVDHPARVADATYKPLQLRVATEAGLRVPATLITNIGSAARCFLDHNGTAIYKPMSPGVLTEQGKVKVINATVVTPDLIDDVAIGRTAHTFQKYVDKLYDARVTVIGEQCFAVAVHARTDAARVGWRADYGALDYEVIDVPHSVRTGINEYCARFGLNFAAFDFSIDKTGTWWFLEANPNGMWAWLEDRAKIPVADAIAGFLAGRDE